MATTYTVAVDEIYGRLKEQWDADAADAVSASPAPTLIFVDNEDDWTGRPYDQELTVVHWARARIQHSDSNQATLGGVGNRLFTRVGQVHVQVFSRFDQDHKDGVYKAQLLSRVPVNAYEGKVTTNVWFRNVRWRENGRQGPWYQINVIADFEWSERK